MESHNQLITIKYSSSSSLHYLHQPPLPVATTFPNHHCRSSSYTITTAAHLQQQAPQNTHTHLPMVEHIFQRNPNPIDYNGARICKNEGSSTKTAPIINGL